MDFGKEKIMNDVIKIIHKTRVEEYGNSIVFGFEDKVKYTL